MFNKLRPKLQPILNIIAYPFLRIHPNTLSFFSFIVALPGFYFYAKGDSLLGSLFVLGALFDSVDGAVARKTGKTSKFGGVLDATLDRVFEGVTFMFIGIGGLVEWEILMLLYTASISVSFIKAKAETMLQEQSVGTNRLSIGFAQRGERIAILFLASILNYFITPDDNLLLNIAMIGLTCLVTFTLVWRGWVIWKLLAISGK